MCAAESAAHKRMVLDAACYDMMVWTGKCLSVCNRMAMPTVIQDFHLWYGVQHARWATANSARPTLWWCMARLAHVADTRLMVLLEQRGLISASSIIGEVCGRPTPVHRASSCCATNI